MLMTLPWRLSGPEARKSPVPFVVSDRFPVESNVAVVPSRKVVFRSLRMSMSSLRRVRSSPVSVIEFEPPCAMVMPASLTVMEWSPFGLVNVPANDWPSAPAAPLQTYAVDPDRGARKRPSGFRRCCKNPGSRRPSRGWSPRKRPQPAPTQPVPRWLQRRSLAWSSCPSLVVMPSVSAHGKGCADYARPKSRFRVTRSSGRRAGSARSRLAATPSPRRSRRGNRSPTGARPTGRPRVRGRSRPPARPASRCPRRP
jgi:hypothetical protein